MKKALWFIIEAVLVFIAAAVLAVVTFNGIIQCSFRYDPPTSSEIAENPALARYLH